MVVHVKPGRGDARPRIAVVASRRVGNAVSRNRAKRVLRAAAQDLPWRAATDMVLVARGACATSDMHTVRQELRALAAELEVLDPIPEAVV